MTGILKQRLINALIALALSILVLIASIQISFRYTRDCVKKKSNTEFNMLIDKLDYVINKIDTLK